MADSACRTRLRDYFTLYRGMTYKSSLLGQPGPLLLGLATIQRNGGFRTDSLRTYGGESPPNLLVHPGDLYVSLKDVTQSADLLGAVARLPRGCGVGRLTQDTVKLEPRSKDVPIDYVHWLLRTPQYRDYCRSHATGTTNLGLPRDDFLAYEIPESTPTRERIVNLLIALDDKIELNRCMNETLDTMARALFKSWFVDFDPVRAKIESRQASIPTQISGLFPCRLVRSQIGDVPEGWDVVSLSEIIEVNPTRQLPKGEPAPYVAMANMPTVGHTPDSVTERPFGSGMRFKNGDTLVARITPCLENGKTAFVDFMDQGAIGWGSTEYIVMRAKAPLPKEFAYCLARSFHFREFMIKNMSGTSGRQRVPTQALLRFLCAAPSEPIARVFGGVVRPLIARAGDAARESRCLAKLRDALLSRLSSGELAQHRQTR